MATPQANTDILTQRERLEFLLVASVGVVFLWLMALPVRTPLEWASYACLLGSGLVAWRSRMETAFNLFEPIFPVFALYATEFPVRAIVAIWTDEDWVRDASVTKAVLLGTVGFICFAVAYRRTRPAERFQVDEEPDRLVPFVIGLVAVSLLTFIAVWAYTGTYDYFITTDPSVKAPGEMAAWFFYAFWLMMFSQLGALLQLCSYFKTGKHKTFTVSVFLVAVILVFFTSRLHAAILMLFAFTAYHFLKRRISTLRILAYSALMLVFLIGAGIYREVVSNSISLDTISTLDMKTASDLTLRYVVYNFEELSNTSVVLDSYPKEFGFDHGKTFLPLLVKPIPRNFMPSKPLGASAEYTNRFSPLEADLGYVTITSAFTEWYMNFGWIGVILGGTLMGWFAARMYVPSGVFGLTLYCIILGALMTWIRGDFNAGVTEFLYLAIPLFSIRFLIRLKENGSIFRLSRTQ